MIRRRDDRGSLTLELAIGAPTLLAFAAVIVLLGRLTIADGTVQSAANEAARAASISRTAADAARAATAAADITLTNSSLECNGTTTAVDTSGFSVPPGQSARVSVTVTCTVVLSDLGLPVPTFRTLTATGSSNIDTYRGRS